ncbi:MAG: D-alanyl-D-alanine carboxypeptidase [Clostridiales bacterium]|nr:D-alanyl-D-alanine carboxypeptidase [Clostridiales bacterium]
MRTLKALDKLKRSAAAFIAAALTVCSLVLFLMPAKSVSADVGQPDVPIPALSEVHCASYCVYDKTTGYIVISMNPDDRIYPASMTKIMTCLLSLELLDTSAKLTVSETALKDLDADSSLMGVLEGEKVKVSELLYGLMLPSGNDAANALGEGCVDAFFEKYPAGGSAVNADGVTAQYILDRLNDSQEHILSSRKLDAFAVLMNLRAEKLGCKGTHFVNACGLPDDNHYTTAYDLAIIMAAASELEDFRTLISAPSHVFVATNRHKSDAWSYVKNSNYLLYDPWLASKTANGTDSHLSAVIGGKTGTTSQAGKGLTIYTVNENGHELMISICGIPQEYYFYTTMYLASVTAYGNLACWENDPVTRVYGTTGDYKYVNAPKSEQPQYDPLIDPGDIPTGYDLTVETPSPTPAEETEEPDVEPVETRSPLELFVRQNPVISGVIGGFMLLIIILNIVLWVRINRIKHAAEINAKKKKGKRK